MISRSLYWLSVAAFAWPAFAQSDVRGLKDAWKDKQFELRNFSADPVVHYTWDKDQLSGAAVNVHGLGVFIVSNVTMEKQKLEVSGVRATLLRDTKSNKFRLGGKSAATIEVDLNGADPGLVLPQLRNELFFPDLDSAIAGLPSPQAHYVVSSFTGQKDDLSCKCERILRGSEWEEIPWHDPKLTEPKVTHMSEAGYTESGRRAKVNGSVGLLVTVDVQGNPTDIWLLKSLGFGLDEAGEASLSKYKFAPALYDGQPVQVTLAVEISFKIN